VLLPTRETSITLPESGGLHQQKFLFEKYDCVSGPDCGFIAVDELLDRAMSRQRLRVLYLGHVQGVGFRYTVKSVATGYELAGRVRNLSDGRVELTVEGERSELEAFAQAVRDSGLGPLIRQELQMWTESSGEFRGFEITQ